MADAFIGEIRMVGGNYAPYGWALCNGQLLSITENSALYTLIGTMYGGDGISNFRLPDLCGRVPVHRGNGFTQGDKQGQETVSPTVNQMPAHTHLPKAYAESGNSAIPTSGFWAGPTTARYSSAAPA
jgi:microcystin-dependent protein